VEENRTWVECMAFLPNHAVGKLNKAAWHDSSSTIEGRQTDLPQNCILQY
jgi:hypothetical protein